MLKVPVAVAVQPSIIAPIIAPIGIVSVKVPAVPRMVPETDIAARWSP